MIGRIAAVNCEIRKSSLFETGVTVEVKCGSNQLTRRGLPPILQFWFLILETHLQSPLLARIVWTKWMQS